MNAILCLCLFVDNPKKKKKKVYKVLELGDLEYRRNLKKKKKQHFIIKWYSSIVLHGTRVYHAQVPYNFFYLPNFHLSSAMVTKRLETRV